jgi:hypothetical protein
LKPVQIDFAPRHGWLEAGTDKRRRPLWALLCAGMLVLLVASLTTAWRLQRERTAVNTRVAALQDELNVSDEGDPQADTAIADSEESVQVANSHLNYPWANMLGILEQNMRPEVTLVSLEMGVLRQSNKLVIESTDLPAALSFVDELRDEPFYATLALTRQETVSDGVMHMRFTLEAPVAQRERSDKKTSIR